MSSKSFRKDEFRPVLVFEICTRSFCFWIFIRLKLFWAGADLLPRTAALYNQCVNFFLRLVQIVQLSAATGWYKGVARSQRSLGLVF